MVEGGKRGSDKADLQKALRARLRRVRAGTTMTQREFAARLGLSRETYSKYETRSTLPQTLISKVAEIGGVSIEYLMCETDDPSVDAADLVPKTSEQRRWMARYYELSERQRDAAFIMIDAMAPVEKVSINPTINVTNGDGRVIYNGPERRDPDAKPHAGHDRRRKILADD